MELNNKRLQQDLTYGLSVGGPIVKINYFTFNVEVADRNESVLNAPGSVTSNISRNRTINFR
jgi:hypothetical protein